MYIYLAARFDRRDELRGYRDDLVAQGHVVTSRWLDEEGQEESANPDILAENPDKYVQFAEKDIKDIIAAELLVMFTSVEGGGWGGHHTEFGFALGRIKPVAIIGPRVNVFHAFEYIPVYPDWESFKRKAFLHP